MASKAEKWKGIISSLWNDDKKSTGKNKFSPIGVQDIGATPAVQGQESYKPTASPSYIKAVKSYLDGDNQGASDLARKALRLNPKDKDAMGLLTGLERKGNYGYKIERRVVGTKK
jgi:hypothetical protein